MRLSKIIYIVFLLLSSSAWPVISDSTITKRNSEIDYYMFPIRPNQINTLAGNMGELRESHFHAGLDIRTGGQVGLPVYAAADGYISRAAVKVAGYGKALYLTHGNGETTVYAHLSKFNGDIAIYSKEYQYAHRNLNFNKYFNKNEFLVKKGDVIAYSGNSGSSGGPHLHFEIRDKDQQILNPQKYHFQEIRDTTPPIFKKLAVTPKDIHARINGLFDRQTFDIKKHGDDYMLMDTLELHGKVAFELLAYDKLNDANYKCAISEISFQMDNELVFSQIIDTINFSDQRNILMHYNYPAYASTGEKFHKLYQDDGNQLPFYKTNARKGVLDHLENKLKRGEVTIKDVLGNVSTLTFYINPISNRVGLPIELINPDGISLLENILIIKQPITSPISIKLNNASKLLTPSYDDGTSNVYLWDLRKGIPKVVFNDSTYLDYNNPSTVIPGREYKYYSSYVDATFGKSDLFDTLYFHTSYFYDDKEKKEIYTIGNPEISVLKQNINITLISDIQIADSIKKFTSAYHMIRDQYGFKGGVWDNNNISFKTRDFGQYTILTDSIAPTISPISISTKSIKFTIKDNLSGINKIDAFVDNQWVLMDYDYKTSQIWSNKMKNEKFKGEVRLRVIDNVGNIGTYLTKIPK